MLTDYVKWTDKTAVYPEAFGLGYCALGLAGEAGEVANKVKKYYRGDKNLAMLRNDVSAELGDVMYYIARLCRHLDLDLDSVIKENMYKLERRKAEGTLLGDGDNR